MPSSFLQLWQIEDDSKLDHTGGVDTDVDGAVELRRRMLVAVRAVASTLLDGGTVEIDAGPPHVLYPATDQETNEAIGWAQSVGAAPKNAADMALGFALAGGEAFSVAQILGFSDSALRTGVQKLVPRLAKGRHPGR